jgi:hypothetical protein
LAGARESACTIKYHDGSSKARSFAPWPSPAPLLALRRTRINYDWLNQSPPGNVDGEKIIAGPVPLGKACVKNVSVVASFGVLMVQGQICNARLEEFTDALAAIGTTLNKDVKGKAPGVVMGKEEGKRAYFITDRLIDMKTRKPVPMDGNYAFICTVSEGGPQ